MAFIKRVLCPREPSLPNLLQLLLKLMHVSHFNVGCEEWLMEKVFAEFYMKAWHVLCAAAQPFQGLLLGIGKAQPRQKSKGTSE